MEWSSVLGKNIGAHNKEVFFLDNERFLDPPFFNDYSRPSVPQRSPWEIAWLTVLFRSSRSVNKPLKKFCKNWFGGVSLGVGVVSFPWNFHSPLKIGHARKKFHFPTIHFRGYFWAFDHAFWGPSRCGGTCGRVSIGSPALPIGSYPWTAGRLKDDPGWSCGVDREVGPFPPAEVWEEGMSCGHGVKVPAKQKEMTGQEIYERWNIMKHPWIQKKRCWQYVCSIWTYFCFRSFDTFSMPP